MPFAAEVRALPNKGEVAEGNAVTSGQTSINRMTIDKLIGVHC